VDGVVGVGTESETQGRVRGAGGVVDGGDDLGRVAGEGAVLGGLQQTRGLADGVVTVGGRLGRVAQRRGEAGPGAAGLDQGEVNVEVGDFAADTAFERSVFWLL
jgi:hypothetical protein